MKVSIRSAYTARRLRLGLATFWTICAGTAATNAEVPVITNPQDLRTLTVNTAFHPGSTDPAWTVMAPMPTARAGFATAAAYGRVYAIGGAILNNCTTTSKVEAYDPAADRWITGLAPLPPPDRFRPSGGTLDNIIYIVGGGSTETGCSTVALDTVQAYDPATDRWSDKPSMPTPRLQVGLGVDNAHKLLYAVGGATASPDFFALDTVEVYDPAANGGHGAWATKQHLIIPRGAPAVAAVNGKIYAVMVYEKN